MKVKPKKKLGQHFLCDENIARKIVDAIYIDRVPKTVLEIGPGMGVLSKYILKDGKLEFYTIEIDTESVSYLKGVFPELADRILCADFLKFKFTDVFKEELAIIGNFPYNISSQILFKMLEYKEQVPLLVGMFQKEVAERAVAEPGTKIYGILSVLIKAYYNTEYLFTVDEDVFNPPPKVKSAVIRLTRKNEFLEFDQKLFFTLVKAAFNQRRKVLRNSIKAFLGGNPDLLSHPFMTLRPEKLSYIQFIELVNLISEDRAQRE